jgi:hypothetical protein
MSSNAASASVAAASAAAGGSGDLWSRLSGSLQKLLARLIELYQSGWRVRWLTHGLLGLGVAYLAVKALHRRYVAKYKTDLSSTAFAPEYDYIVCGAGSAGAALAGRLAEQDPKISVLLLEAGGSDDILNIDVPAACIKLRLISIAGRRTELARAGTIRMCFLSSSDWNPSARRPAPSLLHTIEARMALCPAI